MDEKDITRENGDFKAKVVTGKYGDELFTMRNGWQWTGQPMDPQLAQLTIEVLKQYLDEVIATTEAV